jgi:hypothetical protein
MAKVKKYAKGGSYYVEVKESPKPVPVKPVPIIKGWNIPELKPNK